MYIYILIYINIYTYIYIYINIYIYRERKSPVLKSLFGFKFMTLKVILRMILIAV